MDRVVAQDYSATGLLAGLVGDSPHGRSIKGLDVEDELRRGGWYPECMGAAGLTCATVLPLVPRSADTVLLRLEVKGRGEHLFAFRRADRGFVSVGPGKPPDEARVLRAWVVRPH
jgi:hypothetical protein